MNHDATPHTPRADGAAAASPGWAELASADRHEFYAARPTSRNVTWQQPWPKRGTAGGGAQSGGSVIRMRINRNQGLVSRASHGTVLGTLGTKPLLCLKGIP